MKVVISIHYIVVFLIIGLWGIATDKENNNDPGDLWDDFGEFLGIAALTALFGTFTLPISLAIRQLYHFLH